MFGWYNRGMDKLFGKAEQPTKRPIYGNSLGYVPGTPPPKVPGQSDSSYKDYVKRWHGQQARALANQRGIDTSGMYWDGEKFSDADPNSRLSTIGKTFATGLVTAGVGSAFSPTVSGLVGPTTKGATSVATNLGTSVPTATQAGTGAFLGAANTIPAWVNPAIQAAAAGTPAVANLFAAPPQVSGPVGTTTPQAGLTRPPAQVNLNATNGYHIPGVGTISGRDIFDYGVGITQWLLNRRQAGEISDAQLRAAQEALDWAKEQYRLESEREERRYQENRALEQRRYDEYNTRRAPYREASLASLAELRKLIGI